MLRMRSSRVGINGNLNGTTKANQFFLLVLDTFLSSVVIAPMVIAYWRGTWYLSDIYIFPDNIEISLIFSTVLGTLIQVVFTFAQEFFEKNFHPEKHRILYYVTSRLYTYVYSIACVNLWRGGWKALDFYSETDVKHVVGTTAVSLAVLLGVKAVRNLSSAPFAVILDIRKGYFEVPTMFKLTGTSEVSLYVLDCFFSVFVIGTLVVFVWRGVWCLLDIFLIPENDTFSALGSLVIGYGVVIVVFSIQSQMERLCDRLTGFWRIFTADIYVLFSFIGTINLWRGVWNLLNIYFLPANYALPVVPGPTKEKEINNLAYLKIGQREVLIMARIENDTLITLPEYYTKSPALSNWITHIGSFIFLVLIKCSNSLLVRGVYLDGDDGGKCVCFPVFYLRHIFQRQRRKKIEKNQINYSSNSLGNVVVEVEKAPKENLENSKTVIHQNPDPSPESKQ